MCLCVDLILTIYDPFSPAYRRTKMYYLFSVTASFLLVLVIYGLDTKNNNQTETIQYDCLYNAPPSKLAAIQNQANLVLAMTLSLYIVVAIYSTVYSYRRLHRPGVSASVRNLFVKKHFLYVVVFIVIWMIQQSNNYYYLFNPASEDITSTNAESNYLGLPPMHRLGTMLGYRSNPYGAASNDESDRPETVILLSGLMTFSTGIFLTAVRMYEPLFRVLIL